MSEPSGPVATEGRARSARRWRRYAPALIGFALAALIGGVVGGVTVKATWDSGDGKVSNEVTAGSNGAAAACHAADVADSFPRW